jgi:hypothetical protein
MKHRTKAAMLINTTPKALLLKTGEAALQHENMH